MFEKNKESYCESCSNKNKKDYELVVAYIKENPVATIMEIVTATGASIKSINCFVEDGSLSYIDNTIVDNEEVANKYDHVELKTGKFHGRRRKRR